MQGRISSGVATCAGDAWRLVGASLYRPLADGWVLQMYERIMRNGHLFNLALRKK